MSSTTTLDRTTPSKTTPSRIGGTAVRGCRHDAALPPGELRLTRRGRVVVLAVALLVLMVCGVALAAGSVATAEKGSPEPTETVVVGTGDTLWDIAALRSRSGDVQAMVDHILDLNDLDSAMLVAGDSLVVPAA